MSYQVKITKPPLELKELNEKIIDDTVKEYNSSKELIPVLELLKKENDYVIGEFVELLVMLTEQLANISKDSSIGIHRDFIITQIRSYGKYWIDGYIERCYTRTKGVYRKYIVEQNEEFFLKSKFDDISNGKDKLVDKLFMFQDFWSSLKEENKKILKFYLTTMCCYADIRYVNWNRYLMIKHMNKQFTDLYTRYDKDL